MKVTNADELNMPKSPSHVLIQQHCKISGNALTRKGKRVFPLEYF